MTFDPNIAETRFGTGLSPRLAPPATLADMLDRLAGPDRIAARHRIPTWAEAAPTIREFRILSRARRDAADTPTEDEAEAAFAAIRLDATEARDRRLLSVMARHIDTDDGLRERLVAFWASHFTIRPRDPFSAHLVVPTIEQVIRPHVTGRFADMLRAVTTHPLMLVSLDQVDSYGPNSLLGLRRDRGLNENLARELLELHTVGVDGPYDQTDVRQLAKLLTGLTWDRDADPADPPLYRFDMAEPGAETVMGRTFSDEASLDTVLDALDALADHPATARHLAGKFARHFVADTPDPALVARLEAVLVATGGDLMALTEALLTHPSAWDPVPRKVKWPFDFCASALRALAIPAEDLFVLDRQGVTRQFRRPMTVMGQHWDDPPGPEGWPEAAEAWITPQGMAGRIDWAMRVPAEFRPDLPDPRDFVQTALGPLAGEATLFAASAAESRRDGIAVILASTDFNRR
ncbi:MAG: DUF1800 domain-containing protein [Rubellimicrobium sp.]|nr:DUF1800 domain-containing protein [Rubellimicrobium sp.]